MEEVWRDLLSRNAQNGGNELRTQQRGIQLRPIHITRFVFSLKLRHLSSAHDDQSRADGYLPAFFDDKR